jgi:histone-binding protein RBBP4
MTETATLNSGHKEATNILEERLIDAEYKIWKKNTPYLYNIVATHSLEWPSLTCQWLPTTKRYGGNSSSGPGKQKGSSASAALVEYQLLLGTHTTGDEPNYLMIATCILPPEEEEVIPSSQQTAAASATDDGQPAVPAAKLRYDEEQKEVGGYGLAGPDVGRIEVKMRIKHEGEVNRYVVLGANLRANTKCASVPFAGRQQ